MVEVKIDEARDTVTVRDSFGESVEFTGAEWREFLAGVRAGEFDVLNLEGSQ